MIAQMLMPRPDLNEQARVAAILRSTENLISEGAQTLGKLHRIKAGLMQDLLTGNRRVTGLLGTRETVTA